MHLAVETENLTKDFEVGFWRKRKIHALAGLSLEVQQGEVFGFLGANGAGKTTTLKILMRLIFPTSGNAKILGRHIDDVDMHQRIGYLPENPYFYDYLTPSEYLDYCGKIFGLSSRDRASRCGALLQRVHLDEKRWNTQLRKFSKGMLQRVGMAQALINDPEVVFLDEPMSGLDPIGRREVRDLIASLRSEGKTVFMCSHILPDIEVLCDRVAILQRGRLAHIGRLEELRRDVQEQGGMEVIVAGVDATAFAAEFTGGNRFPIRPAAGGLRVEIPSEKDVDLVICALRKAGGKLVTVQPLKQSLEELFIDEAKAQTRVSATP